MRLGLMRQSDLLRNLPRATPASLTKASATLFAAVMSIGVGALAMAPRSAAANPAVPTCSIAGPDSVFSGALPVAYSATTNISTPRYSWSASGDGVIWTRSYMSAVSVRPGEPGTFTISLTVTDWYGAEVATASRTVVVMPAEPCPELNRNAKILIHLPDYSAPIQPGCGFSEPSCSQIVTSGLYPDACYAMILLADGNADAGVSAVEFGISYDGREGWGVDVYNWSTCAPLNYPIPPWPGAGGGNMLVWNSATACQRHEPGGPGTGVVAILGWFYMAAYSHDVLAVTRHPLEGVARVYDCNSCPSVLAGGPPGPSGALGSAQFTSGGNIPGYNPCGLNVPVMNTTWSGIKTLNR